MAAFALLSLAPSAEAQFLGHNFPGDYGLQSGTQPPPGRYASLLAPFYRSDTRSPPQARKRLAPSPTTGAHRGLHRLRPGSAPARTPRCEGGVTGVLYIRRDVQERIDNPGELPMG